MEQHLHFIFPNTFVKVTNGASTHATFSATVELQHSCIGTVYLFTVISNVEAESAPALFFFLVYFVQSEELWFTGSFVFFLGSKMTQDVGAAPINIAVKLSKLKLWLASEFKKVLPHD